MSANIERTAAALNGTVEDLYNDLASRIETVSDVGPYVADWLDNHPEATTTVEDGSITYAKLNQTLQGKMDNFAEVTYPSISKYNILPPNRLPTGTVKNVEIVRTDDVFTFTGTANGTDSLMGSELYLIPGQKYTVRIYTNSAKTLNATIRYRLNGTDTTLVSFGGQLNTAVTVTIPTTFDKVFMRLGVVNGNVYSGEEYRISLAIGEQNTSYVKYGEGVCAIDGYSRKEIDDLNVEFKNFKAYATPEEFGAQGNGSADDTTALNSCITYAAANGLAVFGAKTYKVTAPIAIDCDDMSIYIHRINSAASIDCALSLTGSRNTLVVDRIYTTNSAGFKMLSTPSRTTQNNYFRSQIIYAKGNAISVYGVRQNNSDATLISYNTFMLNKLQSTTGNCIENGDFCAENQFYNAECVAPSGWGFYRPRGARCYGFSFEESLYGGIYFESGSSGFFAGFRHTELTDKVIYRMLGDQTIVGGTLIKVVGPYQQGFTYVASHYVPYQAIDTSEMTDYTDPTIDEMSQEAWYAPWFRYNMSTRNSQILGQIKYGSFRFQNGGLTLGNDMVIVAGKKICQPVVDVDYTVTGDMDMRDDYTSDDNCYPWASTFIIDAEEATIHLPPSYCCLGYKSFTVDQSTADKTCVIYNSYDPDIPIFNGVNLGQGVYTLTCSCDLALAAEQIPTTSNYYTGRNDKWIVRDSTGAIVYTYTYHA